MDRMKGLKSNRGILGKLKTKSASPRILDVRKKLIYRK